MPLSVLQRRLLSGSRADNLLWRGLGTSTGLRSAEGVVGGSLRQRRRQRFVPTAGTSRTTF